MIITQIVPAPAHFIFNKFTESAIFDVKQQTGETLTKKQLDGFEYVKVFAKNQRAKIKITEVLEDERYAFQTGTVARNYMTRYTLEALDANSCRVTCEETVASHGFFNQLNDKIVGIAIGWMKKKRVRQMLLQMGKAFTESSKEK